MRSIKTVLTIIGIAILLLSQAARAQNEDWFDKGHRLLRQQQYDDAIQAFSTAIDIIPHDYQSYNYRGVSWAMKKNFDRAIADYTKAIEIRPRYAEAYNNRGFAYTQSGDLKAALNDFTRALKIDPFFVDAYNSKAWILATCSDPHIRDGAQAVRLAQKAVDLEENISSMDTLAAAHAAAGNFNAAVDLQTKAIQTLMLEDKTAEVPRYMKHLRSYRSRQALIIDYAARPQTTVAQTTPKASFKASNPKQAESQETAVAAKTPKATATAPHRKKTVTPAKPAPSTSSLKTGAAVKATKPVGAPPARKTPTPVVKPLPYTIQVSSFRDPQRSIQVARKLNSNGDPAFTSPVDLTEKGKWHRVYVGNYQTLEEAKTAANDLKRRKFSYVHVTRKPYTVQIGEPIPKSEVRQLQSRLQAKGYFSYRLPTAKDPDRIRILIGAFADKKAASDLVRQLTADGFNSTIALK